MCCRVTIIKSLADLLKELEIEETYTGSSGFQPTYNASPGQSLPLFCYDGKRKLRMMDWGIPAAARGAEAAVTCYNARIETLSAKATFRKLVKSNRALLPVTGYYEWKKEDEGKIPYYISDGKGRLMLIAALWSSSGENEGFTLVTREPLAEIAFIHDRMPAIVGADHAMQWLDSANFADHDAVASLASMKPELSFHTVSKFVNSTRNNSPECITPFTYGEDPQGRLF